MLRMKASAVIRKASEVAFLLPAGGEDVALEADVVGLGRGEGGEVVGAGQGGGAGVERRAVEPVRPPERPAALEGLGGRAGQEAVAVAARGGVAAGVEAVRRPTSAAVTARSSGPTPLRRARRSPAARPATLKLATWPRAWTPVSVRPATVSSTGSRRTVASAVSSSPCTVRRPGCRAQPRKPLPSYSMSSRTVGTAAVCRVRDT